MVQMMTQGREALLKKLEEQYGQEEISPLMRKHERFVSKHPDADDSEWTKALSLDALGMLDEDESFWTFVAARLLIVETYKEAADKRNVAQIEDVYKAFPQQIEKLVERGLYSEFLLTKYTAEERQQISDLIDPTKDELFTYIGLKTLLDRYVARDFDKTPLELPQERWLVIAMTLMQDEKVDRLKKIEEAYWAMSSLYMTTATPTLSNAGKTHGQLSSCFIDTVDDSLQGIYDSNTDVATLSKFGGGIGIYMGKVRSRGSSIRGFKGASSGVIPWIKQLNNTAVSVDQLGQRQGAIAVYLDVWHKDIFPFLDLKLNNGDERMRAHDIFTGVSLPDIFMEAVEAREEWHLFDPHEVRTVMGFDLEDSYDEKRGEGSFRTKYLQCVNNPELSRDTVNAIDIMKRIMRSQLETGVPFMFYRDEVNRQNANNHQGMIYSSNLCTEIMQNMSATTFESITLEDDVIVTRRKPGDFVVCNLSSINLGRAVPEDVLERLIPIQVRMLDNVIELNTIPVAQAERTNSRYRGIGLGTFGWHHLLAKKGITWESDEAVEYADSLYEKIAFLTIQASHELSKEKGAYPLFEGSDWETGAYFDKHGYDSAEWNELRANIGKFGMRNGYVMAVAPNSSTSIIAGSTASIDPIFQKSYSEEKKDYKIPVTVPELDEKTTWYYKSAYFIDQNWTIKQNAARARHIDQGISLNLYVQNTVKAKDLLELHMHAWSSGIKTTYYVRSTSVELLECESCAS
ncbi:ribonucleoside-diphosphate reductase [Kurthia zopfii]|uniref:Ribonucleoside-diphosphate reductase n=1 Tax=Kurthia zopfii TaxID=1650 RepID=A0A2U3AD37_9BACL|nr:ribonucleoside-diphosphate reductase subunit alpha [Kurthia zopfii]PWI22417.1 ribonucleoside-diphosphate reductase subunit alpha [Kurthia zopfii]TDR38453.1 ribonucleoside-diphosphate reductase alpha chain [Kurthia zopfii]STX08543.1 Ribonucleoside-diphosphate reductase subunit alpha 2 [Kurthia zopfii]VEI05239.1 Ribonucleoside-diphosphate reductase subunit alpha 2 [Kurthia zopfii]GEK30486.1 ribonucleoside-diphosphate reductase [Kurthia zopfii]